MDVQTEMTEVPTGGGSIPCFVARPKGGAAAPAVLVIQEAFGLNAHIKDVAQRVAAEGFVAVAPDMFWRGGKGRAVGYDELPAAIGMMQALKDPEIVSDVDAVVGWAKRQAFVRADRIGITGFCMGGRISYLAACELGDKLQACVPFYGGGIPVEKTAGLRAPVLAFFGDDDPFIPMDTVEKLKAELKRLGKEGEVVVYPKAPHGFFCNERESYRPDAAKDAWDRTGKFLTTHLGR